MQMAHMGKPAGDGPCLVFQWTDQAGLDVVDETVGAVREFLPHQRRGFDDREIIPDALFKTGSVSRCVGK